MVAIVLTTAGNVTFWRTSTLLP